VVQWGGNAWEGRSHTSFFSTTSLIKSARLGTGA